MKNLVDGINLQIEFTNNNSVSQSQTIKQRGRKLYLTDAEVLKIENLDQMKTYKEIREAVQKIVNQKKKEEAKPLKITGKYISHLKKLYLSLKKKLFTQ